MKEDIRFQKTEEIIRQKYLEILQENPEAKVHITELCKKAGISRKTFYAHHNSVEDLVTTIFDDLENLIKANLTDNIIQEMLEGEFSNSTKWHLRHVIEKRKYILPLIKSDFYRYRDMCIRLYFDLPWSKVIPDYYEKRYKPEVYLSGSFLIHAMLGYEKAFIDKYDEIDNEEALLLLQKLVEGPTKLYIQALQK